MKKFLVIFIGLLIICSGGWYLFSRLQTQNKVVSVLYACNGGKIIQAEYYKGSSVLVKPGEPPVPTGNVRLTFNNEKTMTLPQTLSADGTRYANADESFVFWGKGNGALVLENGEEKNYIGCVLVSPEPVDSELSQIYTAPSGKFSLRLPSDYAVIPSYQYELEPNKNISGVKFPIPDTLAQGTNLSADSYVSMESLPQEKEKECGANLFLSDSPRAEEKTENGITYSVASFTGAGAGNRYEETVYAFPGTNPCMAMRYFIHYMVFENYAPGVVKEFDKTSLIRQFDQIRRTLILK